MKEKKISVKLIVSAVWLVLGVVAIVAGILMDSPNFENKAFELNLTNSANNLYVSSFVAMGDMFSAVVLKYLIIVSGAITVVVSSIGIAGSIDNMGAKTSIDELTKAVYDDVYYDEECNGECDSCEMDCEATAEEVAEELTEEEFEQKDE